MASNRTYATGRRKEATARVWISPGSGAFVVNTNDAKDYFAREVLNWIIRQPFQVCETDGQYDVWCTVAGGGKSGQAGAVRHGLAHALCRLDSGMRPKLKRAGLLTRDSRKVERKKYGRPGARKRFQYSKR
jgi:small subunit ribosomal protein S9